MGEVVYAVAERVREESRARTHVDAPHGQQSRPPLRQRGYGSGGGGYVYADGERIREGVGAEHTSTMDAINNLGILYEDYVTMAEAEEVFVRALKGCGKAVGKDHPRTQKVARSLRGLRARN